MTQAQVEPPYILIGDSFGSYNVRLFAARYPEQVIGLILTDGLHESGMLNLSFALKTVKYLFLSGFLMAIIGASLGLIRLLALGKIFELLKPGLKRFPPEAIAAVKRSFLRPKHWITMSRELWSLKQSGQQLAHTQLPSDLPIVNIQANSFFQPLLWTRLIPLSKINQLREQMQQKLMTLSTDCYQLSAQQSGHFVWVDQPEMIETALQGLLQSSKFLSSP